MAWVERLVTRTTQPQDACGIDWSNPLTEGLISALSPKGDVVTQKAIRQQGTPVITPNATGLAVIGTGNSYIKSVIAPTVFTNPEVTLFYVGSVALTVNSVPASVTGSGGNQLLTFIYDSTGFQNVVYRATNGGGSLFRMYDGYLPVGIFKWGATYDGTSNLKIYNNGDAVTTNGTSGTLNNATPTGFDSVCLGGADRPSDLFQLSGGEANVVFAWNRALSAAEHKLLNDNPWAIFEPEVTRIWVDDVIAGAGSSITAASGSSITSTATGQAQAASTQTAATGTSTSSTLTGAAVVSATITAANGTSTTGTLAAGGSSAATTTPAGGTSTASTMVGSSTSGANVADGPPIGGFVAIGQLGPASPVASGSTIAPASGSSIAETLTSSTSAAATITSAAGTSVTSTMVGASTSGTAATMTAAGGASITSTMTSAASSSADMLVNSSTSITSAMVGFPPTENNADTHDGYFHKLWAKLAKKPEYQLEILEERLEEIAEEIKQVKDIPVVSKSAITPQLPQFDAQAKLLQALIVESARIRRDIEDEEEAEMLLML